LQLEDDISQRLDEMEEAIREARAESRSTLASS
jgi:hypothetical protein